jgi:hypothetical protein
MIAFKLICCFCPCSKILCDFDHGTDSTGAIVPMKFAGKDFVCNFDDYQQLRGEMMHYVISQWKSDPLKNAVFASGSHVLLSPYFISVIFSFFKCTCSV